MLNPVKSLEYIWIYLVIHKLKFQQILSDRTARRSAVERRDLKPDWKSEKMATSLVVIKAHIISIFFQDFTNPKRMLIRVPFNGRSLPQHS